MFPLSLYGDIGQRRPLGDVILVASVPPLPHVKEDAERGVREPGVESDRHDLDIATTLDVEHAPGVGEKCPGLRILLRQRRERSDDGGASDQHLTIHQCRRRTCR